MGGRQPARGGTPRASTPTPTPTPVTNPFEDPKKYDLPVVTAAQSQKAAVAASKKEQMAVDRRAKNDEITRKALQQGPAAGSNPGTTLTQTSKNALQAAQDRQAKDAAAQNRLNNNVRNYALPTSTTTGKTGTGKTVVTEFGPGDRNAGGRRTTKGDRAPLSNPTDLERAVTNIWGMKDQIQRQSQAAGGKKEDPKDDPKDKNDSVETPSSFSPSSFTSSPPTQTLIAAKDVVDFTTPPASVDAMTQILFESLSSFELVNMARRDTIEGLNPYYTLISNLSSIRTEYSPSNIIGLQDSTSLLQEFQISLDSKIPSDQYLTRNNISNFFYIDSNGDFVIELDNMLEDEFVEIQMANSGKITYKAD